MVRLPGCLQRRRNGIATRTVRDFQAGSEIAPIVDAWAQANHFDFQGPSPGGIRNYQRRQGLGIAGTWPLMIRQSGSAVHLEAWVHSTLVHRVYQLFLTPADIGIDSAGGLLNSAEVYTP